MGVLAGPVGLVTAYLASYVAHGASNPMHTTLLHRQVDGRHRLVGGLICALAAPLYIPAWRAERGRRPRGVAADIQVELSDSRA